MLAPFMVEVGIMLGLDPLVVVLFLLWLIVSVSFKIPETLNRDLPDYIEEERWDTEEVKPYNPSYRDRSNSESRPRSNSVEYNESSGNDSELHNYQNRSLQTEN